MNILNIQKKKNTEVWEREKKREVGSDENVSTHKLVGIYPNNIMGDVQE